MKTLYKFKNGSAAYGSSTFEITKEHAIKISFLGEPEDGSPGFVEVAVIFSGVLWCQFFNYEVMGQLENWANAYDAIVDLGETTFLQGMKQNLLGEEGFEDSEVVLIRHLRMSLDDGPCYEIVCETFKVIGQV